MSPREMTVDDLPHLGPDLNAELVRGELLEMTRPGFPHGIVSGNVYFELRQWTNLGTTHQVSYDVGVITRQERDSLRGPDVLVTRNDKVAAGTLISGWLTIAPELVVEVLSPNDRWPDVLDKTGEYLAAGVGEVWVIDPEERSVTVFRSNAAPRSLGESDTLAGEKLLPGLTIPVVKLFAGI